MPARSLVLVITLFWIATTGWLFYRDVWPRLRSGQPPPYTIDLADEAMRKAPKILWNIYRKDKKIGVAYTWLKYRERDDTFELHSEAKQIDWGGIGLVSVQIHNLSGMYRVTRDGQLRDMLADITLHWVGLKALQALVGPLRELQGTVDAHVEGEVKNERFIPQASVRIDGSKFDLALEPVPVSSVGRIVNLLHPLDR